MNDAERNAGITPAVQHNRQRLKTIVPSMRWNGEDLPRWKKRARAQLRDLLGMDRFQTVEPDLHIEYERELDNAVELRFTFQSEAGYRVPCHLLLPRGVEKPPVMVCLQGHSTGMHISLGRPKFEGDEKLIAGGDRDFCIRAVKEGFAAIAMEQRGMGECGGDETGPKCQETSMTALLMGRTTIGERVWDVCRLIDVLEQHFAHRVDLERLCCMGNSGGGTVTAHVAALDDRIRLAMPSSAVCAYTASIGAYRHCVCNFVPRIAEYFDMGDLIAMAWPKYYVHVHGLTDWSFNIDGARQVHQAGKQAYAGMGDADRIAFVEGSEGHRFYADDAWPIVHRFMD